MVEITEQLTPDLHAQHLDRMPNNSFESALHAGLCRYNGDTQELSTGASLPSVPDATLSVSAGANHWVFLTALPTALRNYTADVIDDATDFTEFMMNRGYLLHPTVTEGNCGPDLLTMHLGWQWKPTMWRTISQQLQEVEFASATVQVWRGAFALCGEVPSAKELLEFKVKSIPKTVKDKITSGFRKLT